MEFGQTELNSYFNKYKSNGFKWIPENDPENEFQRLRKFMKWEYLAAKNQKE